MSQKTKDNKPSKFKQFFSSLVAKIDKKMEEQSKSSSCCRKPSHRGDKSCCS
jgi:hypothetical protein